MISKTKLFNLSNKLGSLGVLKLAKAAGYYKGVDASNVKTKKVLNENCHFWANFNKNFTNDTTN